MRGWKTPENVVIPTQLPSNDTNSNLSPQKDIKNEDGNIRLDRHKKIEDILSNNNNDKVQATSVVYWLSSIAAAIFSNILITMWPQHQTIGDPTYWYESSILSIFLIFFASQILVLVSYSSLEVGLFESYKTIIFCWLIGVLTILVNSYHVYIFWVYVAGYVWPMPFQGYPIMVSGWWAIVISFGLHTRRKWKSGSPARMKIFWAIIFINCTYISEMTYLGVQFLFGYVNENWHWPLVLVILLVRELHVRGLSFTGSRINGGLDLAIEINAVHLAAIRHILFLSVNLGSMTTASTSYLILASDFIINLGDCFAIIYYHRKGDEVSQKKKIRGLVTLISNEATEFMLPLAYASVLLLSYYGPNAHIMGNIRNSNWHYAEIENIYDTVFWLGVMFLVDSGSTVASSILLWIFCKDNIVTMYLKVIKYVGLILAAETAYFVSEV